MRWYRLSRVHEGEKDDRRVFLFLPKCLGSECRWLEFATIEYEVGREVSAWKYDWVYKWIPKRFVD